MRTKTLLLTAMLGVAGIASSYAQNVYSVNVVGYITLELTNTYTMIANQLDDGQQNYVTNVYKGAPTGTTFSKYVPGSGYVNLTKIPSGSGWSGSTAITCAPGEGLFVRKPPTPAVVQLTATGEVVEGVLGNPVVSGYDIYGAMVPQEGGLSTVHAYPLVNAGDVVSLFTPTGYRNYTTIPGAAGTFRWSPSEPSVKVGEGFWIRANAAKAWDRSFTVPRE